MEKTKYIIDEFRVIEVIGVAFPTDVVFIEVKDRLKLVVV